jgi:hypothetical protein
LIGHILCRNCLLRQVIEGKIKGGIEVTGRWGRRHRKLLDDLKERKGYFHLKQEALDHNMWRALDLSWDNQNSDCNASSLWLMFHQIWDNTRNVHQTVCRVNLCKLNTWTLMPILKQTVFRMVSSIIKVGE